MTEAVPGCSRMGGMHARNAAAACPRAMPDAGRMVRTAPAAAARLGAAA